MKEIHIRAILLANDIIFSTNDLYSLVKPYKVYVQLNTVRVAVVGRGVLHTEGGWPRDVNCRDPEQTARYRKKAERDEEFIAVRPVAVL